MATASRQPLFSRRISLEYPESRVVIAVLRLCLALAVAAPVTCQSEAEPYFALSSSRMFGSHERPEIMLSGWHVPEVQIRVYRVKDPVEFVRKMEDAHSFGGRPPRPSAKPTLLERIHNWKRGLRRDIRLNLRGQFTESPRAHLLRTKSEQAKTGPSQGTRFADIPLLNPDQLVLSFAQRITTGDRWSSQQVPVAVKDKGLFLVEAVSGKLRAYTVLVVSDVVLLTKVGRDRLLGYLMDRETGQPVADAGLFSMVRTNAPEVVRTNQEGLAEIQPKMARPEDLKLIAQSGRDVALASVSSWSFFARARNLAGTVYTDRPVYRPGDTTRFRAILRIQQSTGYSTPAGQSVTVQINDPEGKPVYQKDLTTNKNGVVHDELALEKTAALGMYYVELKSGDNSVSGSFEVQEYKKPEYEVRVTVAKPRVLQGETVAATIDAHYYFGEPVNGAKVQYSVYRSRYWYPLWYSPDEDTDTEEQDEAADPASQPGGEEISNAEGKLDSDGKLTVEVPTTLSESRTDYRYRIEARVTDAAGREISGTGWMVATYGSFVVQIEPSRYFYQPGSTGSFHVQARNYDNQAVSVPVRVAIEEWRWNARKAGAVVSSGSGATDASGSGDIELRIPSGGVSYKAVVTARTPEGRTVEASTYVWVESGGGIYDSERGQTVQIVPDKKSYRPGDTARLLIVAGQANTPVLVSVEGRDIRGYKLVRSTGATALFEYKVTRDDEPGFFISAQFIRKGKLYSGVKRVKAPPEDHKLNFQITTDKTTYLPGQSAHYQIAATTPDGKPVANADLSLGVVDEAIYAIRKDATPDLLDLFYGREYNSVYTESSLNYFFNGEAGTRRMQLAALRPESALAQLKPDRMVQPKIRKLFPDTAFWAADLTTDANGRATATVPFPDSLTTWRATVRGASADDRFGGATLKTIVRKNLILRLAVPRFFVQGDEVVISGLVHNYLTSEKRAQVSVKLAGLELAGPGASTEVTVPSRGEVKVDWRVKAQGQARRATIIAQALTNEESDALEMELPINPPGVPVRQAKGGTILNSGNADFAFSFPGDAVAGSRSISIRLSPSIAGSIFSALEYLTSFPYGCVEQTMSSFLPDLMVTKAVDELKLKPPGDPAVLQQKTQAGLDRLYSFQHDDGGWGWWQTDDSHPFMSAYVVAGLAEAKRAAIAIDEERMGRGADWVKKQLNSDQTLAPDLRAYMLYALELAGKPEKAAEERSYRERQQLSPYGLALLGLAFEQSKDTRAKSLADQLAQSAKQSELEAWWPASRDEMLDFDGDVTPEASAFSTKLLSHERPGDALLPKAALWLVNHRSEGYWWASSKQTAMVIYGLLDYVKASRELQPNFTATVKVNGQPVVSKIFKDSITGQPELVLDESKLQPGTNRIEVSSSGEGRLYYAVSAVHYSDAARLEKQGAISLNVLRDYFRLTPGKEGGRIVYDLTPLDGPVAQGDTLAVRLTVTGSDWRYLMVEDPIPAGTEFIERDQLYELRNKPPWWRYWFTRRELHDNRMAIFQTRFYEGQQQYFYLLKVVNPGSFHVSPARVQPMYQPGISATTEARTVEAK